MRVEVETTSGLERRLKVELPEEQVAGEVGTRLKRLVNTVRLPGFRPGMVPLKLIEKRYGEAVRGEVVGELIDSSFAEAVQSENLQMIERTPRIDSLESEVGQGVRYSAVFEVYPEIELTGLDAIEVRRPQASVEEGDIDRMIETLRERGTVWQAVERAAKEGDRISFDLEVDGEEVTSPGGAQHHHQIELGAGRALSELDAGLTGAEPGSEHTIEVSYPDDFPAAHLAGQTKKLQIAVREVEESSLPEVDADFVRSLGIESGEVEELRRDVRANLERELEAAIEARVKERLLDAMAERFPVEVPAGLLATGQEAAHDHAHDHDHDHEYDHDHDHDHEHEHAAAGGEGEGGADDPEREFRRARVLRDLLVRQLVIDFELQPDEAEVRAAIERMAATYQDPAQVVRWFHSDPQRMQMLQAQNLERQAIDAALARVRVVDEPATFDELVRSGQTINPPL